MNTTTQTKPHQPTYLEPAYWSKDEQETIFNLADHFADLPQSMVSVIESAFLTFDSGEDDPSRIRDARKMMAAARIARDL
jgi:hypothetical protein